MNRFKSKIPKNVKANENLTANRWYSDMKAENVVPTLHPIEKYGKRFATKQQWFFLTKEEIKQIWKNRSIRPKKGKEYFDWIVEEKIAKWERKHPKPQDDLFKEEFMLTWNKEREEELTRIRDVVISQYDKTTRLEMTGRYKKDDTHFEEKRLDDIPDSGLEFKKSEKVVKLTPETSKTIKMAQLKTDSEFKRNPNLVCTSITNKEGTKKRILIPSTKVWTKYGVCA